MKRRLGVIVGAASRCSELSLKRVRTITPCLNLSLAQRRAGLLLTDLLDWVALYNTGTKLLQMG
jgi:hypothetical protein